MSLNPKDYENLLPAVRTLVNRVVKRNLAEAILFSAGTDTQIIAYEAVKYKPKIKALTMAFKHGNPKDTKYVNKMVEYLNLNQETHTFSDKKIRKLGSKKSGSRGAPLWTGHTSCVSRHLGLFGASLGR